MSVEIVTTAIGFTPAGYLFSKLKEKVEDRIDLEKPTPGLYVLNLGDVADIEIQAKYYPPQIDIRRLLFSIKRREVTTFAGLEILLDGVVIFPPMDQRGVVPINKGAETGLINMPVIAVKKDPGPEEIRRLRITAYHEVQTHDGSYVMEEEKTKEVVRDIQLKIHNPFGVLGFTIDGKNSMILPHKTTKTQIPLTIRLNRNPALDPHGSPVRSPDMWNYKFKIFGIPNLSSVNRIDTSPKGCAVPHPLITHADSAEIKLADASFEDRKVVSISIYFDHVVMTSPPNPGSVTITLSDDSEVSGQSEAIASRGGKGGIEFPVVKQWSSKVKQPANTLRTDPIDVNLDYVE